MNYITQINTFERWLETNYLPAPSQLLWYKLIALFNRCGWTEWITVDNQRLMGLIQCESKNTFLRARDQLIEAGLIEYRKGKKGAPNQYRLTGYGSKNEPQMELNTEPQTGLYPGLYPEPQTGHINKQRLKQNKRELPPISPKEKQDVFAGYGFSQAMADKLSDWLAYKQEKHQGYKPKGLEQFLGRVTTMMGQYGEEELLELIGLSMANNWQGIPFDRLKGREKNSGRKTGAGYHEQTDGRPDICIPGITEL